MIRKQEFPKVAVALATHSMVHAAFTYSLAQLAAYSVAHLPPKPAEFGLTMVKGTYVHGAREQLLEMLLKRDITHVLWIDTDMQFPRDALMRLLAHKLDMVGINYCQRGLPYEFVAIKHGGWSGDPGDKAEKLHTLRSSKGLEQVDGLGFGMVLMRADTMRRVLPPLETDPWFWFERLPGRRDIGEDIYFCRILKKAGVKIFVDHDLSKDCQHIGEHEFDCVHAEEMLAVDAPELEPVP